MKKTILASCLLLATGIQQSIAQSRTTVPFNQNWQFTKGDYNPKDSAAPHTWETINIPHTWNNKDMQAGKDFYAGNAIYKKNLFIDAAIKGKQVFLRFEGVGQVADVYVNNKFIGQHKGGYSAFAMEITYALNYGSDNNIIVKVNNEPRKDVIPINNNLFGIYGGIYRPVSLVITDKLHITTTDYASPGVYIRQQNVSAASADITVTTKLDNRYEQTQQAALRTRIYTQAGELVKEVTDEIKVQPQGRQQYAQQLQITKPHRWNGLQDPHLYKVVVSLIDQHGQVIDESIQPLGIRKFEIKSGKGFYLNDEPYRLYGVCRHQDWWGYGSALENWQHAQDLDMIREMGANSIRFAHYQQADYIYAKCDSIGFVIWAEVPFVNAVSGQEGDNAKQQITELVKQQFNHPSIYTWGMHNEVYEKTPADHVSTLTADMVDIAKTLDPDRYTVSTNGYGTMERPENRNADIQGMNRYYGWYEGQVPDLEKWVSGLEEKYPEHKVVLSEYGGDGNVNQHAEILPPVDYNGPVMPEERETRIHEVQWGIIEKHPYLVSSYLWNMFDFCAPLWSRGGVPARNMKGLVTFDRQIKKDVFYWYKANWSKEPVVYISDRRLVNRKQPVTTITVYDNIDQPVVTLNGKKLPAPKQGTTHVHYLFENVKLRKGKNVVVCTGLKDGKKYEDKVEWVLE
ncbi:glycoside hydrolase family 2 protein [Chitinophaga sp. Cy-1792]|uniref:glycoside hydrolase family 2 protein n=1 Tax=Chitinophaga sp. Cy-1792 TaxID=2608339 RepID=UPI00141DF530|nr:glycoside hydrolase family 2 TIM barrel-domain containing protein [Chitinophaga sp. Cy-1792]